MKHTVTPLIVLPAPTAQPALGPLIVQEGQCPYFLDKRPTRVAFTFPALNRSQLYDNAIELGMRRSGLVWYRPICDHCRKCIPIRIRVQDFRPSISQRRVLKKTKGQFALTIGQPILSQERIDLYQKYLRFQHGDDQPFEKLVEQYHQFLVETNVHTLELAWRDADMALIAVGIVDVLQNALSSVYFFWDPDLSQFSLGTFSALKEIDLCREMNLSYYHFGYLVPGVPAMDYKAKFAAAEVWDGNQWIAMPSRDVNDNAAQKLLSLAQAGAEKVDAAHFASGKRLTIRF